MGDPSVGSRSVQPLSGSLPSPPARSSSRHEITKALTTLWLAVAELDPVAETESDEDADDWALAPRAARARRDRNFMLLLLGNEGARANGGGSGKGWTGCVVTVEVNECRWT